MPETTKRPERKVRLDIVGGLEISEVSAELASIVPGRQVDDNAHVMLRFNNGAKGMMWVSMVAAGHMQGQRMPSSPPLRARISLTHR